mmetsp:Transcript_10197/g.18364  ORF Transcript_10197/g.18364 Transcript_10197/m.18364 type:complete len:322 (+) Transcript_10197:62-1027(+)
MYGFVSLVCGLRSDVEYEVNSRRGWVCGRNVVFGDIGCKFSQRRQRAVVYLKASGREDEFESSKDSDSDASSMDWREFRARLVASEREQSKTEGQNAGPETKAESPVTKSSTAAVPSETRWAHEVATVEEGALLVACPIAFLEEQAYFQQAVICIVEHNAMGTIGFILNRPITYSLQDMDMSGPVGTKLKRLFPSSPVYFGGDVSRATLSVLHTYPDIPDSMEVVKGVYAGGLEGLLAEAEKGNVDPETVRFFSGYCGWSPNQLEREVANGVWYLAAGSPSIISDQCIRLPRPLWRQVLDLMGSKFAEISAKYDALEANDN